MNWWEQIDADQSKDEEKAARIVNVLAKYPGSREMKVAWLLEELPAIEAEAAKQFDPEDESRKFGAAVCSLAIRYWRWRLKKSGGVPRTDRNFTRERISRSREMPQQAGPRDGTLTKLDPSKALELVQGKKT